MKRISIDGTLYLAGDLSTPEKVVEALECRSENFTKNVQSYLKAKKLGTLVTLNLTNTSVIERPMNREEEMIIEMQEATFRIAEATAVEALVCARFDKLASEGK